jgi:hypothetical protein
MSATLISTQVARGSSPVWRNSEKIDLSAFWLTLFRLTPLTPLCYRFDPAGRRVELVDLSDGLRKEGFCLCGFKSSRDD